MKIYVDKIPDEGLELTEKIDPSGMFLDAETQQIFFTNPIDVKASIRKTGGELFVEIALQSIAEYICARCIAKFQDVFKKRFSIDYEVKEGDIVEIDEDIRQEIILAYPVNAVCREDCKGLCPNCGHDLNAAECGCNLIV